jgi:uncharacterized protein YprB with RNaseH-like and TPR domain
MKIIMDIETTGLNPMEDRVLCISYKSIGNETITIYSEDEKEILEQFWYSFNEDLEIIGFNSDSFDLPFIIKRSLINNIKVKKICKTIDLRKVVNSFFYSYNKLEKGSLREWALILGINPETHNGSMMNEHFLKKEWDKITQHCKEDIIITEKLYERCLNCNLL